MAGGSDLNTNFLPVCVMINIIQLEAVDKKGITNEERVALIKSLRFTYHIAIYMLRTPWHKDPSYLHKCAIQKGDIDK